MKIIEHYLVLRSHYKNHITEVDSIVSSISDVAEILSCSVRNANFILNKLKQMGWIEWHSRRGRGNKSRLVFKQTLQEAAEEHLLELIEQYGLERGYSFIQSPKLPDEVKQALLVLFKRQFGFHSEEDLSSRKDTLTISHSSEINSLIPAQVTAENEASLVLQIYDRLVVFNEEIESFESQLLHSWDTANGEKWTFYLRKGIMFHTGKELTSEDVAHTFQLLSEQSIKHGGIFTDILKVKIENRYTITCYLKQVNYLFLPMLSSIVACILPKETHKNEPRPIGTGPFKVVEHSTEKITLKAFSRHFNGRPFLDKVDILLFPDLPLSERVLVEQPRKNSHSLNQVKNMENGSSSLFFNFRTTGVHQDEHFRKAINKLINRSQLIEDLSGERASPANGIIPKLLANEHPYASASLAEAREHLKKSGYRGEIITLTVLNYKLYLEDAHWIQAKAKKIGLTIHVHPISLLRNEKEKELNECEIFYGGIILDSNIDVAIMNFLQGSTSILRTFFNDRLLAYLSNLLELAKHEESLAKRTRIYQQALHYITEENAIIFIYHKWKQSYNDDGLSGLEVNNYGWVDFHKIWLKNTTSQASPGIISIS